MYVCVWLLCVASNFVTRSVSIPITPWDGCSSEKGQEQGAHFTAARVILESQRHSLHLGEQASQHLSARPLNSRPGSVKFTFSVYLACLRHSTTHRHSRFQQDVKLQQTSGKHSGRSRIPIAIVTRKHSQQSNSGPLHLSEAGDNAVVFHPAITLSSDWTDQNLRLIILCTSVTAGPDYILLLFQKSRHR